MGGKAVAAGIVFEMKPPFRQGDPWIELVLYHFKGGNTDGSFPLAVVVVGKYHKLYGTTQTDGPGGAGTVFKLTPPATHGLPWTETTLYGFTGSGDGLAPYGGVTFDGKSGLYGTTSGYASGYGSVFKLTRRAGGSWSETTLYDFTGMRDGGNPFAGLTLGKDGFFYGTTMAGGYMKCPASGFSGCGTVFRVR